MNNRVDLNALIGSRICHDLISPLGAIGNGVELLTMSGATSAPEIALIAESVENANARIRFFRIAYGAAPAGAMVSHKEVVGLLRDMYRSSRVSIDWRILDDLRRSEAKLSFLLMQCLESALPRGGKILVTRTDDRWHLIATGERLKFEPELWKMLEDGSSGGELIAADVQFALAPAAAAAMHRSITMIAEDNSLTLSF